MSEPSAPQDGPADLRILLAGLPKSDVVRLEVFLRVRSDRLHHGWSVVSQAPVDVYVHDADDAPTIPGCLSRTPVQIRVAENVHPVDAEPRLLQRPLQYDAFVEALLSAERSLSGRADTPPAAAAPPAAAPAAAPALRLTPLHFAGHRFRLRRWPAPSLLQTSRYGMRMASFISARFLSMGELARLSGVEEQECARFLSTLMDSTLLRTEPLDEAAPSTAAPAATAQPAEQAARPSRSLLSSLRSKLGIALTGR